MSVHYSSKFRSYSENSFSDNFSHWMVVYNKENFNIVKDPGS